jgi:hypothetical protein
VGAVELTQDDCSVSADHAEAMAQGLASLNADDVRVLATGNFVETVAEVTGNSSYTADRGGGVAAARTVTGAGGSVVIVNYDEVASRSPADVQRILAHEGGHVRIDARGTEETSGNRDADEADWQWWLKCLGAQAIVEFRIERSLAELGYHAAEWLTPRHVDYSLLITNVEVVSALIDPASADPAHLHDALLTTLNHATKLLAYIAAPLAAGQPGLAPSQLSTAGQEHWADYIAPTWQRRVDLYAAIPSAAEPVPVEGWRVILRKAAVLEQRLLRDFGFAFSTLPDGRYGFFRKASDAAFEERRQRALAQTETQAT